MAYVDVLCKSKKRHLLLFLHHHFHSFLRCFHWPNSGLDRPLSHGPSWSYLGRTQTPTHNSKPLFHFSCTISTPLSTDQTPEQLFNLRIQRDAILVKSLVSLLTTNNGTGVKLSASCSLSHSAFLFVTFMIFSVMLLKFIYRLQNSLHKCYFLYS